MSKYTTPARVMFNAQSEIEFPRVARAFGFKDESYGNDACAQATLKLPFGEGEEWLQLWVNHESPFAREERGSARFTLCYATNTEQLYLGEANVIASSESEGDIAAAILTVLVMFTYKRPASEWVRYGYNLWLTETMLRFHRYTAVDPFNKDRFPCAVRVLNKLS